MKKKTTRLLWFACLMLSVFSVPVLLSAAQDMHPHPARVTPPVSGQTPLIEEMLLLDKVFQEVVSAVALGDGQRVLKALEPMHGAMEKTQEGVLSGTVKIPKKAHRVREFIKLDKKFHMDLEALARAAQRSNQQKMLSLTKKLLDGCVNCHRTFKK